MTTRYQTKKTLNEFVGTALAVGAGLAALGGVAALRSGQKKGTGFRYRVGEKLKNAWSHIDQLADNINAYDEAETTTKYHDKLADAMSLKPEELGSMLAHHEHIKSIAPDRDHLKSSLVSVIQTKTQLDKNLIDLHRQKRDLQTKDPITYNSSHPDIQQLDQLIHQNNINNHVYTGTLPQVIEKKFRNNRKKTVARILDEIDNTDYEDLHGRKILRSDRRGGHYTVRDIITDTHLEHHLNMNPVAKQVFKDYSRFVFTPSEKTISDIKSSTTRREADIQRRRANISQDLDLTKQEVAQPAKNPFESGISLSDRISRLKRNRLFDAIRTSM